MMQPGIEPRSPEPLENTLPTRLMSQPIHTQIMYSCNECPIKTNFSPKKQGIVHYLRYVAEHISVYHLSLHSIYHKNT